MTDNSGNRSSGGGLHFGALPAGYPLGHYRFQSVLGVGGFGITYRAADERLRRPVAIKEYLPTDFAIRVGGVEVRPRSPSDQEMFSWGLTRFLDEARTLAALNDAPNIVHVYDYLEANGTGYMVMELIEGEPLDKVLARVGKIPATSILPLLPSLLKGLEAVHRAGYLHRDIKPANILVRTSGEPVLVDFGAARMSMGQRSQVMTSIYSPGYAPPEQYAYGADADKQGPPSDIYALAATLYHAITGSAPADAVRRLAKDSYIPLTQVAAGQYPPGFLAALDAALALPIDRRPQSVAAWSQMLFGDSRSPGLPPFAAMGPTSAGGPQPGQYAAAPNSAAGLPPGGSGWPSGPSPASAPGQLFDPAASVRGSGQPPGYAPPPSQQGYTPASAQQGYTPGGSQQGYQPGGPPQGYPPGVSQQGYQPGGPQQGYPPSGSQQGYQPGGPQQGYPPGGSQQGYQPGEPQQGYPPGGSQQGYQPGGPQQGYQPGGPQQGYPPGGPHQGYQPGGQGYQPGGPQQGYAPGGPQPQYAPSGPPAYRQPPVKGGGGSGLGIAIGALVVLLLVAGGGAFYYLCLLNAYCWETTDPEACNEELARVRAEIQRVLARLPGQPAPESGPAQLCRDALAKAKAELARLQEIARNQPTPPVVEPKPPTPPVVEPPPPTPPPTPRPPVVEPQPPTPPVVEPPPPTPRPPVVEPPPPTPRPPVVEPSPPTPPPTPRPPVVEPKPPTPPPTPKPPVVQPKPPTPPPPLPPTSDPVRFSHEGRWFGSANLSRDSGAGRCPSAFTLNGTVRDNIFNGAANPGGGMSMRIRSETKRVADVSLPGLTVRTTNGTFESFSFETTNGCIYSVRMMRQ